MQDKLQKAFQLVLFLIDSAEAFVKRRTAKGCVRNWDRFYPEDLTARDLPQRPPVHLGGFRPRRAIRAALVAVLFAVMLAVPALSRAQTQQSTKPAASEPVPEAAIPAILAAFDKYEVVGLPQGHGMQDMDDFIFSLIRNPRRSQWVDATPARSPLTRA